MMGLPKQAWHRFEGWLVVGLFLYLIYGLRHSKLRGTVSISDPLPFSVGAFGTPFLWLAFHGRLGLGLLVLLAEGASLFLTRIAGAFGTALTLAIWLMVPLWLGLTGSGIAKARAAYQTIDELKRGERPWTILGIIILCLNALGLGYALLR